MENYFNTFLEIAFMIIVLIFLFYIHILHNNPVGFLLAYIIFIKLVIKILVLLDGS